ncbi:MAG: GGDEF domain-containing protein, partial [Vulcanisaeta sp.]|nr:GGDEF domain-containing protein [Vulcanisaeta sp.]
TMYNINKLIESIHKVKVPLEAIGLMIHFRDRNREIEGFFTNVIKYRGVSLIYGPRGAGKSTLAKVLEEEVKEVEGFNDLVFVRYTFEEETIGETQVRVPGLGIDVIRELEDAANVNVSMDPITLGIKLIKPVTVLARALRNHSLRDKRVIVIYDDIDRFLRKYGGYEMLEAVANKIPDIIREHDVWVKALFTVSDQAAVNVVRRLGGKGGMRVYLLWNLPRQAFVEVINEVAELTGAKDVNSELLWNLLGGNMREFETLVGYGWDYRRWIERQAIMRVIDTFRTYQEEQGLSGINDVLARLIEKGKAAASSYGLGEFTGQPDAVEGFFNLLRENTMIYLGLPGLEALSEMPSEPWIGKYFAYQIPAYYWVIKAMVKSGKINVTPEEVLDTINYVKE